jgi:hypothetical protein
VVEARGLALPVCEARLPVAGQRVDLAGLEHTAQSVVLAFPCGQPRPQSCRQVC